jgi:hypothetical protein
LRSGIVFSSLERFFSSYKDNPSAADLLRRFRSSQLASSKEDEISDLYERAIFLVEEDAVKKGFDNEILELQRGLYRELDGILRSSRYKKRHHFVIVVPVADRPIMLQNFIESLIEQFRTFGWGDTAAGDASVFVIDDSKDTSNISLIMEIVARTAATGLPVSYVGRAEQGGILKKVPADLRLRLSGLIGDFEGDLPGHKGASVTRNIAYLYFWSRLADFPERTLFWFVDSDEEFRAKVKSGEDIKDISFINYFYWIDRIFASSDAEVLTGKVVGDPPVTPAVMINTFLEDVLSFLETVSDGKPGEACIFHAERSTEPFSAEYHDMTGLFGYQRKTSPKRYRCGLTGSHTLRDCFHDFSDRATGFFSGLHPTRTQCYLHAGDFMRTEQARTVYTGNYVIRRAGLGHFLPFASLGLRMAGPTLGRILKKRLGMKFVSANLPLLHKRTLPEKFTDEFRSGIHKKEDSLDLSGEFVRQFWGDVMLFSVEELTRKGYPDNIDEGEIAGTVRLMQEKMWKLYGHHQAEVAGKISRIRRYFEDRGQWWSLGAETKGSVGNFLDFCEIAGRNFGPDSKALKDISAQIEEGLVTANIIREIGSFREEDRAWREVLKDLSGTGE